MTRDRAGDPRVLADGAEELAQMAARVLRAANSRN